MQRRQLQNLLRKLTSGGPPSFRSGLPLGCGILFFAGLAFLTCGAQQTNPMIDKPYVSPELDRLPDANDQMRMREKQANQQSFEVANTERKKQLSDDSAKLLTLAMALKAEVDKTNKDTLSLNVIRKADEIERLAHSVKEKMKLTVGGS